MVFSKEEYNLVEDILLNGNHFNRQQRAFIELFESKIIIASPGAGKTTSLAAKIILLLRYLYENGSRDGVCIITHTNVAVNEINTALQKAGIKSVSHPHFIGTIHEFFNRFCVTPYFKKEYGHNALVFGGPENNDKQFYKRYIGIKKSWIKQEKFRGFHKSIVNKIYNNPIFYNEKSEKIDMINRDNWAKFEKYKQDMIEAKLSRKMRGFLQYDDTFLFSKLFLNDLKFKSVIRNRFKYVFIDEFQDTTVEGIILLKEIFNDPKNVIQMVGDPYQTIMYEQPMPTLQENQLYRMNLSNRFGNAVALPLNQIMPEANIQVKEGKESFKPIILVYQEEQSIYPAYKNILDEYERENSIFKECDKADKVLIRNKGWASRVKEGVTYSKKKTNKRISKNVQLKNLIIDFICGEIIDEQMQPQDLKEWVINHPKIHEMNNILLNILKCNLNDDRKKQIRDIINCLLTEKNQETINVNNSLFRECESILHSNEYIEENTSKDINDIFTIHSVKGETLRSALIVNFDKGPLVDILLHQYGILDEINYKYTDRNLLYVALSRVTCLFVFAIHEDELTDEARERLSIHWIVRGIN
ncbi:hypothetical protein HMI01_25070 [Halolactibacillus miurensis]|uniref:UvrD-like helicase ATP-binding domain-containing protein n=1 Tax=Halolactibacillus miurensis TaxID=306541 RepID=A0ABQ0VWR4_9BACI|nr:MULTISPECIES: UvrD-helicase domain-containing protein [Halolactibacillus]GEM05519.1 hypothetical protein HMI01_25070 [Halolactibacillus miurensis]